MSRLTDSPAWRALQEHQQIQAQQSLRDLFASDKKRFERFSLQFGDILLDYSKNQVSAETMALLYDLADSRELKNWIDRMFAGERINHTEQRAVLHTALRKPLDASVYVDGVDVMPEIRQSMARMKTLVGHVRAGEWKGFSGQPISDVVNLGVGGSDLGPQMVSEALRPYGRHSLHVHFVSNVDSSHISDTLRGLKPETTLFIISSKSFTTQDTLANAEVARKWVTDPAGDALMISRHFIAVTDNIVAANAFGIVEENIFRMWDWVGGRYSLWSAIGLSVAIYIGMENFKALLEGAHEMDEHFRTAPWDKNLPVTLALMGIWYNNFFDAETYAVLPYDQHLQRFPAYLQQVDMESNGKSIDRDGKPVDYATGPILWGELGITGQHAFYQLLHQGSHLVPADFIVPYKSLNPLGVHQDILLANFFAQTEALMCGKTEAEARTEMEQEGLAAEEIERLLAYKVFTGNKPTNTILFESLTPKTLGALMAMYEHKIFTQGVIWNINSFDQWGVELGKQLTAKVFTQLRQGEEVNNHDASSNGLINHYLRHIRN
ncbi:glucose-6-phosphate isomerase [Sulfuriflexus mobilis]|uniref:glucose-6-phosphate isomerase n=1 Tax=Sulfuriflexus mobilis TaxID=1811807 RepID=UPI000F81C8A5|nr:glucose-6-phosphate isomerase [Sulfuriflexus mobilis]